MEFNLKNLESYCQRPDEWLAELDVDAEDANRELAQWLAKRRVLWPSHELLRQINGDVIELAIVGRKKPILPVWKAYEQVDRRHPKLRLVSRVNALIRRAEQRLAGESELEIAAQELEAGNVRGECLVRDILCRAKSLRQLLNDDRRRIQWKTKACPLVQWLITIGHPFAKKDFGPVVEHYVLDAAAWQERKRFEQREKARTRIRRHRKKIC